MARIPLPSAAEMTDEQRGVLGQILSGERTRLVGPLRAVIHSPELAARWSPLGEYLRFGTVLPPKLKELAILATGRRWTSQVEFAIHAQAARDAGLDGAVIEAIRRCEPPRFAELAEAEIYEFTRQLQQAGTVTDAAHAAIVARYGVQGVVELTAVIGYYTMVAMTLNAHEIPLPDDQPPPLGRPAGAGLATLPPATQETP